MAYDQEFTKEVHAEVLHDTYICAQSFEEFLYRFWLENCIEFTLIDKHRSLTEIEQHYLMHYSA
jgi:hypothetical protein